jgi:hypothetical protein
MCQQQHFDVLFTYDEPDEIKVLQVAAKLREYGLEPWVRREQIRPGTFYQDSTQQALASINCRCRKFPRLIKPREVCTNKENRRTR